ncbi:MAG TPA: hypothetical protein VNA25_07175, partial [Phycisphaerae bacterium]|nr:hypothetical protein [Phycisphaerae bacterium]
GKEKGYELVCVLDWNALFVRAEYFPLFEIVNNHPMFMRPLPAHQAHLWVGYDGQVHMEGGGLLPWHRGIELDVGRMQALPRWLRQPRSGYTWLQRAAYRALVAWRQWTRRLAN